MSEQPQAGRASSVFHRVRRGAGQPGNWLQLLQFATVGGSGYVVNLAVYAALTGLADLHYIAAAIGAFIVAVTNNFFWNRIWTFRAAPSDRTPAHQGGRFLTVSLVGLGVNLAVLELLIVTLDVSQLPAQAIAVAVAMPVNFIGNKLWTFG